MFVTLSMNTSCKYSHADRVAMQDKLKGFSAGKDARIQQLVQLLSSPLLDKLQLLHECQQGGEHMGSLQCMDGCSGLPNDMPADVAASACVWSSTHMKRVHWPCDTWFVASCCAQ